MSRLSLGTVQFGLPYGIANKDGQVSRAAAKSMLELAATNGIDTLDTAVLYGKSETCLGEIGTKDFKLVTKLPALPEDCADVDAWVQEEVAASLARLGVDSVYGLLLHRPGQLFEKNGKELYQALQVLKETGKAKKVGVTIYSPSELKIITAQYKLDLIQAPFNLIDNRLHTSGWLKLLKLANIEIHVRSAFLQGLLLMPRKDIPTKFAPWSDLFDKWHEWLSLHAVSALQACLAYPLSFPEIDRVVVGADSVDQLEQIIDVTSATLPDILPDLSCEDENLINPSRWSQL